jgi:hypothetical protein
MFVDQELDTVAARERSEDRGWIGRQQKISFDAGEAIETMLAILADSNPPDEALLLEAVQGDVYRGSSAEIDKLARTPDTRPRPALLHP